eukprot:14275423-Ditylum_brightwellii.AAC.1
MGTVQWPYEKKIKANSNYNNFKNDMDVLSLIKAIRGTTFKFKSQRHTELALVDALKKLFFFFQMRDMDGTVFFEIFKNLMLVIDQNGGNIYGHPGLMSKALKQVNPNLNPENATPTQYVHEKTETAQRFLAVLMIKAADRLRYGSIVCDLENDYTHGINGLPKTMADAYSYIAKYLPAPKAKKVGNTEGLAFVTTGDEAKTSSPISSAGNAERWGIMPTC